MRSATVRLRLSAYLISAKTIKVDLSCGTTNALLAISEPEKCEYFFKVTSPALCWPLVTSPGEAVKEEL